MVDDHWLRKLGEKRRFTTRRYPCDVLRPDAWL